MVKPYIPKKGDIILLQFDPQSGHEQKGQRPGLVISDSDFNKRMGFTFVCPISNTTRYNPFYIPLPSESKTTGVVMVDQMKSLDYKTRKAVFLQKCDEQTFDDVLSVLEPILF